METEESLSGAQLETQHMCCSRNGQNGFTDMHDFQDGDNTKDCCQANLNGSSSSELTEIDNSNTGPTMMDSQVQIDSAFSNKDSFINHSGHAEMVSQDRKEKPFEPLVTTIRKEPRFELRAFQEEKKPSKLFDSGSEKEPIRVKKVRDAEEMEELERERQELIRSQAVKKNPGIATKWWNPPQIRSVEEELDPEQLESHRKYQERKQKKTEPSKNQQESPNQTNVSLKEEELSAEHADPSTTQTQLQPAGQLNQPEGHESNVTTEHCCEKLSAEVPESTRMERPRTSPVLVHSTPDESYNNSAQETEVTSVESKALEDSSTVLVMRTEMNDEVREKDRDVTCAHAVMTILEDPDLSPVSSSCHPEEIDSGLDDLSVQSHDTATQESLCNDFGVDSVSDSDASNAFLDNSLGDFSLPITPQATSPVDKAMDGRTTPQSELSTSPSNLATVLTEEPAENHTNVPVQKTIQKATISEGGNQDSIQTTKEFIPSPDRHETEGSSKKNLIQQPHQICDKTSPAHDKTDTAMKNTVKVTPVHDDSSRTERGGDSRSLPAVEKHEFSYFSKYSEAAELRSTASLTRPRDVEVSLGPCRLRSHKQRTLSIIEQEIRAAEEREQELKRQRQARQSLPAPSHKERTISHPTRLVVTGKTAPGKIEKVHCVPGTSSISDSPNSPTLSDVSSEGSDSGQRPKNFMQTLMDDYETHKVKRKEKTEDDIVLEATRVTRHKNNMAVQWEAGVYSNQEEE
ncbi:hypothetical protein JZ751_027434 [Albula glossodonta]|uniref:A-kinase anchor protein 2 C-terminal domain-containing protein n=1 Tax=Albula glossodonta TaxID=121402 RepID=A0A8T2NF61_9TELE|nr:hypothetical protein JZ751_027434 [Albula glossodonta]